MSDRALAETRAWVDLAVIGLNLCPFAKAPQTKGQVRYALSEAREPAALLQDLMAELKLLTATSAARIETTLLVHPHVLADFADYNDFLDVAEAAVAELGLEGEIQVASFHPRYRFAGTEEGDVANATNRSPWPTLHLLREDSVERAVAAFPQAEAIYEANMETLRRLGVTGWDELQRRIRADP
jgi:hypothetical protein